MIEANAEENRTEANAEENKIQMVQRRQNIALAELITFARLCKTFVRLVLNLFRPDNGWPSHWVWKPDDTKFTNPAQFAKYDNSKTKTASKTSGKGESGRKRSETKNRSRSQDSNSAEWAGGSECMGGSEGEWAGQWVYVPLNVEERIRLLRRGDVISAEIEGLLVRLHSLGAKGKRRHMKHDMIDATSRALGAVSAAAGLEQVERVEEGRISRLRELTDLAPHEFKSELFLHPPRYRRVAVDAMFDICNELRQRAEVRNISSTI